MPKSAELDALQNEESEAQRLRLVAAIATSGLSHKDIERRIAKRFGFRVHINFLQGLLKAPKRRERPRKVTWFYANLIAEVVPTIDPTYIMSGKRSAREIYGKATLLRDISLECVEREEKSKPVAGEEYVPFDWSRPPLAWPLPDDSMRGVPGFIRGAIAMIDRDDRSLRDGEIYLIFDRITEEAAVRRFAGRRGRDPQQSWNPVPPRDVTDFVAHNERRFFVWGRVRGVIIEM